MFESRLAPAPGAAMHRDLSSFEIWEISLARSLRRRELAERQRKAAPKTKGAAAAMSAALLVSPVLPVASASAQSGGGPASAPPSPGVAGVIVKRGDVGPTVAEVQRRVGVDDDAIFGPITERAVGDFQDRSGLRRTGVVDVTTWKALFRASVSFVQPDSAAAKRIVAQLPRQPQAPKRQVAADGGQAAAAASEAASPDSAAPKTGAGMPPPAAPNGGSAKTAPAAPAPVGTGGPAGSDACGQTIVTPVRGTVTSRFGDGRNHEGIDIAAPVGTAVRAAQCGTVSLAGSQSGYGNIICIQHSSSFSTCYAHLSEMSVRQGTYVKVGQVIGRVGMTGRTTGPHLHFETRVGGRAQDPSPYLSRAKSIPGKPRARTARAVAAPEAKASPQMVASRSAAGSLTPAHDPQGDAPRAPAPPVQQQALEPAPAPTQAPEPPRSVAPPAPQQAAPAPAVPSAATPQGSSSGADTAPASPSATDKAPAPPASSSAAHMAPASPPSPAADSVPTSPPAADTAPAQPPSVPSTIDTTRAAEGAAGSAP